MVVDRFTKEVELIPTVTIEAEELAEGFVERVVARYNYLRLIISDRGT